MSKSIKVVMTIVAICLTLGTVLACIGASFGGMRSLWFDARHGLTIDNGPSFTEEKYVVSEPETVNRIRVSAAACSLRFVEGDELSVYYEYNDRFFLGCECTVTGDTLDVNLTPRSVSNLKMPLFNLGWNFSEFTALVTIAYPRGTVYESIDINVDAAAIELGTLYAKDINLTFTATQVNADLLFCDNLNLKVAASDLNFYKVSAKESAVLDMDAGQLNISQANLPDTNISIDAGEVTIAGQLTGDCQIRMSVGNLELSLNQPQADFRFVYKVEVGHFSVNDISVENLSASNSQGWGSGSQTIDVRVQVGSVSIKTR